MAPTGRNQRETFLYNNNHKWLPISPGKAKEEGTISKCTLTTVQFFQKSIPQRRFPGQSSWSWSQGCSGTAVHEAAYANFITKGALSAYPCAQTADQYVTPVEASMDPPGLSCNWIIPCDLNRNFLSFSIKIVSRLYTSPFFSDMDECKTRYQNFRVKFTSHRLFIVFFPNYPLSFFLSKKACSFPYTLTLNWALCREK